MPSFLNYSGAIVKDMEAAAIVWLAELNDIPFIALKVVTDIVDGDKPTEDEFFENLGTAARSLEEKCPKLIKYIMDNDLHCLDGWC